MDSKSPLLKIIFYSGLTIINVILLIIAIYILNWRAIFFLTLINLVSTTVYLIMSNYFDFTLYYRKKQINDKTLRFWRDIYFKYSYILSQIVFVLFWMLSILGENFMILGETVFQVIASIYAHGIICQIMTLDLFITEHRHSNDQVKVDIIIFVILLFIYTVMQIISKYAIGFNIYPFLELLNLSQLSIFYILTYFISLNIYQLYIHLVTNIQTHRSSKNIFTINQIS